MSINLMSAIFRTEFRDLQDAEGNTTKASTAKFVCIALADHANDEGEGAYPKIDTIALKTNLSRVAVINALDALKYNGVLSAKGVSKRGTINYTVNPDCFSGDSKPALLVNPVYPDSKPALPLGVNPLYPNHTITIQEPLKETSKISKKDIANASPEWAILGGMEVSQDSLDRERIEREAVNAFESAFGITRPWDWWVADKDWRDLRAFVVEQYRADSECFKRYVIWSRTPYVKGAMTSLSIKRNPELFRDSWDVFKVQDKPQVKSLEDLGWK